MDRVFLTLGSAFAFLAMAVGAFGAHALKQRLSPERLTNLETAVRYQLWHALALFVAVFVRSIGPLSPRGRTLFAPIPYVVGNENLFGAIAGWLFVAGIVLFSGSLYALAWSGSRRWGAVTPVGGLCFLLGWLSMVLAALTL